MIIGIDEVGRGALAGPVVVGAASLPEQGDAVVELCELLGISALRDSKKLSRRQREKAATFLMQKIHWAVGEASNTEIDEIGLAAALRLAAGRAINGLSTLPTQILADASLYHPFEETIPTERFVKGDEKFPQIAYASIIAKVWRDAFMREQHLLYPDYGFASHVGYGTLTYREAIKLKGFSPLHRHSFRIK